MTVVAAGRAPRAPRPLAAATVAATCLVVAVASRRLDLVAVAVPSAAVAALAVLGPRSVRSAAARFDPDRVGEAEPVGLVVTVDADPGTEVLVRVPPVRLLPTPCRLVAVTDRDGHWEARLVSRPVTWGSAPLPVPAVDVVDCRCTVRTQRHRSTPDGRRELLVVPTVLAARHALTPLQLRGLGGLHLGPRPADGLEYAATRAMAPGDPWHRVNPRVSSRRDELFVDDRHPDLSGDVTILVDSLAAGTAEPVRRMAVSIAAAVADVQRRAHDRVGLVEVGGIIRWLAASDRRHRVEQLLEWLAGTHAVHSEARRDIRSIPPAALPRRGLVVALTPLVDPRSAPLLFDLAERRRDVAVVAIEPPTGDASGDDDVALAWRIWELHRSLAIEGLVAAGADVVRAAPDDGPGSVLLALARRRRARRRVS